MHSPPSSTYGLCCRSSRLPESQEWKPRGCPEEHRSSGLRCSRPWSDVGCRADQGVVGCGGGFRMRKNVVLLAVIASLGIAVVAMDAGADTPRGGATLSQRVADLEDRADRQAHAIAELRTENARQQTQIAALTKFKKRPSAGRPGSPRRPRSSARPGGTWDPWTTARSRWARARRRAPTSSPDGTPPRSPSAAKPRSRGVLPAASATRPSSRRVQRGGGHLPERRRQALAALPAEVVISVTFSSSEQSPGGRPLNRLRHRPDWSTRTPAGSARWCPESIGAADP